MREASTVQRAKILIPEMTVSLPGVLRFQSLIDHKVAVSESRPMKYWLFSYRARLYGMPYTCRQRQ